jgi:hypothetical protein
MRRLLAQMTAGDIVSPGLALRAPGDDEWI